MTVRRLSTLNRYIGLSTDGKPTDAPVGSTFFEYDTQIMYIIQDGNLWERKDPQDIVPEMLSEVIAELRAIRRGHECYLWNEEVDIE